jgi:uncharacterized protein involved in response to NO
LRRRRCCPRLYYRLALTAGLASVLAFGVFLLIYGPMLVSAKRTA